MKIKDKIAKLIDVKSLVTLILTAVFAVQTLRGIKLYIRTVSNDIHDRYSVLFRYTVC